MKNRIISAFVIALLFAVILYFGENAFFVATIVLSGMAYKELIDIKKDVDLPVIIKVIGLLLIISIIITNSYKYSYPITVNKLAIMYLTLLIPTIFIKKYKSNDAFYVGSIVLFLGVVFTLLINLYLKDVYSLLYVLVIACVTDIFALFTGMLIGKHKLTKISPKKTIEGSIGGTIFATIIGVTYYSIFIDNTNIINIIIISIILSIVGQIGDLFFSLIKRENDKKDYSNLIPGHGGILDRLDSIIFILLAYAILM